MGTATIEEVNKDEPDKNLKDNDDMASIIT